jgi:Na+/melibiose symporter-like transporter
MGLNEFAGYGGVGITALLTGYIAARTALRPQPFYLGIAYAFVGLGLSIVAIRDTTARAGVGLASVAAGKGRPRTSTPVPDSPDVRLRTRTMFGVCQAGLFNNLNDGISWGVLPLFFTANGLAVDEIGVIKAVYPLTWSVAQLGTGTLADRLGRRPLIVWGMIVQALALGAIALIVGSPWTSGIAGAVLLGVGTAMVYPALLALAADISPAATRATTLGWYRFWRDLGYPSGALLAGVVSQAFGLVWAVALAAALTFVSALGAAVALTRSHVPTTDNAVAGGVRQSSSM